MILSDQITMANIANGWMWLEYFSCLNTKRSVTLNIYRNNKPYVSKTRYSPIHDKEEIIILT